MDKKLKTVILLEATDDDWVVREFRKNGFDVKILFRRVNKFFRGIRRLWILMNIPFKWIWYGKWTKELGECDQVILFVSTLDLTVPKYINKIAPNVRVIGWYWNSVIEKTNPKRIKGRCEKWSFDPENCKKYGMHFNHQFYFKTLIKKNDVANFDVYFCGSDSGRGERIVRIYEILKNAGLRMKFQIVYPQYNGIPKEIISEPVSYQTIADFVSKSRCILEITRSNQSGLTERAMEALFNNKKLITDNVNIIEEPFYSKEQFFVLGKDPIEKMVDFIYSPIQENSNYVNKYDVSQWFINFNEGVE